ncbi:transmembrane emp24 domain-containing protein 6-like protein [Leptotrombidium deliense]|uniref:Transmembrane emp24 domain-containing protein 6-like protein n=1 Tax=Leptotrombidium deliense TaxID=299467 RepID=A0A443SGY1_9ACAR|nr:transmembrane emp24 domain-containing protein 6-like protein [Leptotrombidium deliense]
MAKPQSTLCKQYVSLVVFLILVSTTVNGEVYTSSDPSEKLGVAFEFKIHVDAGREECFYQFIHMHSTLYVAFQVMKGGDGRAGFSVRNPNGVLVLPHQWQESNEYEEASVATPGFYEMCIDNTFSRFAAKLVSLYVASYKKDEWEKYIDELTAADVTSSIQNVDQNIATILKYVEQSKRHITHDWYLVDGNNRYVQNWSLLQCVVIILSSVVQAFVLKSLFSFDSGQKGKPRA